VTVVAERILRLRSFRISFFFFNFTIEFRNNGSGLPLYGSRSSVALCVEQPPFRSSVTYFSSITVGIRDAQGFIFCLIEIIRGFPPVFLDAASVLLNFISPGFRKTLVTIVLFGK
jgi:hypothetical protein